jgi:hypothetical protein
MKKIALILFLAGTTSFYAQAQDQVKDSWPAWTISKDVHRIKFKNIAYTPAAIKSGNSDWVISKGVHRAKASTAAGNVSTSGYPTWTISKGVARQQAERKK